MTLKFLGSFAAATALTCVVATVTPAFAQRRDARIFPPEKSGNVIVTGCLMRGEQLRGGDKGKYVLALPKLGSVASVAEARCTADSDADALALDHAKTFVNDSMVGQWVEISGRLEKETSLSPNNLRELDVEQFRVLPVVVPRPPAPRTAAAPAPAPAEPAPIAAAPPAPAELPPALPTTASPIPAFGIIGLLSLAGAFVLRSFRRD